ncbi:transcriptional regulator GcvA [Bowmanella denitrificans]|uniref:Transcriptional regulator GcvA n=1 Tax=Bowmanella denitrificans TaxID=366582 RepID=A0ABN0X546_9ALTE
MLSRLLPGTGSLRILDAAARHLNFTRAAEEVGLTPAAVSYQIKEIEGRLGVVLFERTSRSIKVSEAGKPLLTAVAEVLALLDKAIAEITAPQANNVLQVSLPARLATNWLMPKLADFKQLHPEIQLALDITDDVRDLVPGGPDVAIRFGRGQYLRGEAIRLTQTRLLPVASRELWHAADDLESLADLTTQGFLYVDCQVEGLQWPDWSQWFAAAGLSIATRVRTQKFSDTSHLIQAVLAGGGIGLVEPMLVGAELANKQLIAVSKVAVSLPVSYAYYLLIPTSSDHKFGVSAFKQWLVAQLADTE